MNPKINITITAPVNDIHYQCFIETAELIYFSLIDLDYECLITVNQIYNEKFLNIVLGCQFLDDSLLHHLPKNTIIFNLEPICDFNHFWRQRIEPWLNVYKSWDYSHSNLDYLNKIGIQSNLFKFGYQKQLSRIAKSEIQDIDVLHYGAPSERRMSLLNKISEAGYKVVNLHGVYREERDAYISRSRIVLNIYSKEYPLFDSVRCFYLMNNSKAIISEENKDDRDAADLKAGIDFEKYENLLDLIITTLNDEKKILGLEKKSYEAITKIPQSELMRELLQDLAL